MGRKIEKIRRSLSLWRVRNMFIWPAVFYLIAWVNKIIFNTLFPQGEALAIIGLILFYAMLGLAVWQIRKTWLYNNALKPIGQRFNKLVTDIWGWATKGFWRKLIAYSLFLLAFNFFNLLNPIFNVLSDIKIIAEVIPKAVVDCFTNDYWSKKEKILIERGELWCPIVVSQPAWLKKFTPRKGNDDDEIFAQLARFHNLIASAAKKYQLPLKVIFGLCWSESSGRFAKLPDKNTRGLELGISQMQRPFAVGCGMKPAGYRESFMNGENDRTYLEYARSRQLVMLCGLQLPKIKNWPIFNYAAETLFEFIKYYFITSIDDRLGVGVIFNNGVFDQTAKNLRQYYDRFGSWDAAIAAWIRPSTALKLKDSARVQKYLNNGEYYLNMTN